MAKSKSTPDTTTSDDENKEVLVSGDTENNIDNLSKEEPMATTKTDEQIYKEIQALKPRAKYQEYFEQQEKAIKTDDASFKKKVITNSSNVSVAYEDIMSNVAYCIKKYKLFFMFDLSEEQTKLITDKPLFWFAQKRF